MHAQKTAAPWQFSIRHLLLLTAFAAFTAAAAATMPRAYGAITLLVVTLILPGALATIAAYCGPRARTFCLPAIVPIVFGLYGVGWGFGWTVYNSTTPDMLLAWFEAQGVTIKTVVLAAWACGALAGFFCAGLRRMLRR